MVREAIEKEVYEAASEGNVTKFLQLHQHDRYLVERVSYAGSNILHIATLRGEEGIVEEVLNINPKLARKVDSEKLSPLHIAAAEGSVAIAQKLLVVAPEVCWCRDGQGMNPVHVAAVNGRVEILEEMLRLDSLPAMERAHRGQTVMHLCVKHRQLGALEVLVKKLDDLVEAKDDDGETLLHWAARSNHEEIIKYLVRCKKIDKQSKNSMGKTAAKIFKECHSNPEVEEILKLNARELYAGFYSHPSLIESGNREQAMVAMVLIATMAFQAIVSPPGGVWQDDTPSHRAGEAVMASTHPYLYQTMATSSAMAFLFSVVAIFFLASHNPIHKGALFLFASQLVAISLAFIAITFGNSLLAITPNTPAESLGRVITPVALGFFLLFFILAYWVPVKAICKAVKPWRPRRSTSRGRQCLISDCMCWPIGRGIDA